MAMRPALLACSLVLFGLGCVRVDSMRIGHTRSGKPEYRITCNQNMGNCYGEARRLCPAGFTPMGESGHHGMQKIGNDSFSCSGDDCTENAAPRVRTFDGALLVACQ
jgi:hypothetical protein